MLTPMIGIFLLPTLLAAFKNVPSPPKDTTKSASKLSPSNELQGPTSIPFDVRKRKKSASTTTSASQATRKENIFRTIAACSSWNSFPKSAKRKRFCSLFIILHFVFRKLFVYLQVHLCFAKLMQIERNQATLGIAEMQLIFCKDNVFHRKRA